MKIKIKNHTENTARVVDYPGTIKLYIGVHFAAWGFYDITKAGKDLYYVTDAFTGEVLYTVTRAGRG